jgi:hypothetical protein
MYAVGENESSLISKWAPTFVIYDHEDTFNRIGRPTLTVESGKHEKVWVDPDHPMMYFMQRGFVTEKGRYTNLIYRVHFPEVPFSIVPFHLTAGKNGGLMVVVTMDANDRPVLITSVHTCGCYLAIVATDYLPAASWPENRPTNQAAPMQNVYGETLPLNLHFAGIHSPRLILHIRPGVHRVADLEVVSAQRLEQRPYSSVEMGMAPMDALMALPENHDPRSFFHDSGVLKGHVKGAFKPLESIFLSLISMDLFVGMDKIYADPEVWGNRFYTSLKPWRREDSDMWDFVRFLRYWGWRL